MLICPLQFTRMAMYVVGLRGAIIVCACVCLSESNEAVKQEMPSWHGTPLEQINHNRLMFYQHAHTQTHIHTVSLCDLWSVWSAMPPVPFAISHARLKIQFVPFIKEHAGRWMTDHSDHSTETIMLPPTHCHHMTLQGKLSLCNMLFILLYDDGSRDTR